MKFTDLFINRPVLATVLNLLIVVTGVLAYRSLGVNEYPTVSIPVVTVTAPYPNASAEVIETDLTPLLEEQLAGVEGLDNIASTSSSGFARVELTFRPGVSMDRALAQVRDRVGRARAYWPKEAKEPLIEQQGNNSQAMLWLSLTGAQHGFAELTHFARLYVKNQLQTIAGVSSIIVDGQPYVMLISLNRLKMFAHGVSASDVVAALSASKTSFPAGKFKGEIPVTLKFELEEAEDFANVVIKKTQDSLVLLQDIANVALVPDENRITLLNGKGAVFLGIIKTSDGNPLAISSSLKQLLPRLKANLPQGVELKIEYDGANFIRASLGSIRNSILEASALVLLIIFLFLRNWRATLIPLITIPISLIGTLSFVSFFGFSINTISLLAMVLGVGLVVDDAIVVLENIHHHIEKGASPLEAAKKGSREIAFAIIAMTFTLASVYAPIAFIGGVIGQLFIEFALTLAGAVVVSGMVALTLSPMMCSKLLNARQKELFPIIDKWIISLNNGYRHTLSFFLRFPKSVLGFGLLILASGVALYMVLPSELAPKEDRGFVGAFIEPLPGKPVTALVPYAREVEKLFRQTPEVSRTLMLTEGDALVVVAPLKDWAERKRHSVAVIEEMREKLKAIPSINPFGWNWDTGLPGIELADRGASLAVSIMTTGSYQELHEELDQLQKSCENDKILQDVWFDMHLDYPGLRARVDDKKMALLDISPSEIAKAIETSFDKSSPLEFLRDGIRYNITLTNDSFPDDLSEVYVNNVNGVAIPLSTVVEFDAVALPSQLKHTKQLRSATFGAQLGKKQSLSQAIDYIQQKMRAELPEHFSYELTGVAQKQQESSNVMLLLFLMALVFIYCVMAIQFNSFVDPFIILLTVPLAGCGALFLMWLTGQSINIFSQIGLITLVGLITKHGILIVDFANRRIAEGSAVGEGVLEAASQRLRPVLMTTGAMVFGSIPLMMASGAGSEARRAIGYVLVGGLSFGTLFTLFVVPVVYLMIKSRTRLPRAVSVIGMLVLLFSSPLSAQELVDGMPAPMQSRFFALEATSTPSIYTLDQAIERALEKYETILANKEQIEQQRGLSRQALARVLPKLNASASIAYQNYLPNPQTPGHTFFERQGSAHLRVPIIDIPGILSAQNGSSGVDRSEASYARSKQALILDVARSFFALVAAEKLVKVAQSQLGRAEGKVSSFQRQVDAGHASLLDLQREKILAQRAWAQVQNTETDYKTALGALGLLIHESKEFHVIEPTTIRFVTDTTEELLNRACRQREDLRAQQFAVKIAERDHLARWFDFLPKLHLDASLGGPYYNVVSQQDSALLRSSIALQLELPLYDGGAKYGLLRTTRAKSREERFNLSLIERTLKLEIQGTKADIERKKKLLDAAMNVLELTQSAQKSAENMYAVGQTTSLDLVTAQTNLFAAENDVISRKLDMELAGLALGFVVGEDIRKMVAYSAL